MRSSRRKSQDYSHSSNGRYVSVIVTVIIAVLGAGWFQIDSRLSQLDGRMRSLERQVTALAVKQGCVPPTELSLGAQLSTLTRPESDFLNPVR